MKNGIAVLLFTCIAAISHHHHSDDSSAWVQSFEDNSVLKEELRAVIQSKIGSAILKMAELNTKLQGPVDELIETVRSFQRQLEDRIEQENADFAAITAEHSNKKLKIQSIINQAEVEMNKEKKRLYQDMLPRKDELDRTLNQLKDEKVDNTNQVTMMTALRKQQHEAFFTTQGDLGDSIAAVDEGLKLLETYLPAPGTDVSLIQLEDYDMSPEEKKDLTKKLRGIKVRLESTSLKEFNSYIQTLSNVLDKQNFSQRQFIKSLIDNLNQLRFSLVNTMNKLITDEAEQQKQYEQRLQQLQEELDVFDTKYSDYMQEREEISATLSDADSIIQIYVQDSETYQKRLEVESNNFAMNQKVHDELLLTINEEINVIEQTIKILKTPAIQEYLQNKMGKLLI